MIIRKSTIFNSVTAEMPNIYWQNEYNKYREKIKTISTIHI